MKMDNHFPTTHGENARSDKGWWKPATQPERCGKTIQKPGCVTNPHTTSTSRSGWAMRRSLRKLWISCEPEGPSIYPVDTPPRALPSISVLECFWPSSRAMQRAFLLRSGAGGSIFVRRKGLIGRRWPLPNAEQYFRTDDCEPRSAPETTIWPNHISLLSQVVGKNSPCQSIETAESSNDFDGDLTCWCPRCFWKTTVERKSYGLSRCLICRCFVNFLDAEIASKLVDFTRYSGILPGFRGAYVLFPNSRLTCMDAYRQGVLKGRMEGT